VKLLAHRAGLPGEEIFIYIVPFDPVSKTGLAGHVPAKSNLYFSTIEPNIFVSSVASLIKFCFSVICSSFGSVNSSQYPLSFASFRDIFILITKSFLLNASSASI
jgi:hypothetical protein